MDKTELWHQVYHTNKQHLHRRQDGLLSVKPMYQILRATELWGAFGTDWGVRNEVFIFKDNQCLYTGELYYPSGELPIHADKATTSTEWSKAVATDALTKGLSKLGFSADVFFGEHDNDATIPQGSPESFVDPSSSGSAPSSSARRT